ncbi:MAG: hypothetical protein K8T90_10230 [Planctomycetes bacterium]|nr:hypothetical protein [Planctomycetota bacterium]
MFISFATSKLRVDVDRLTVGLTERGLRFEGLTRSNVQAVPPGLCDVAETAWDGGDPVDTILALVDATIPHVTKHRSALRRSSASAV